jgi:hypothetical protein
MQLSPVVALTLAVPEGVRMSPTGGDTKKSTVTACPTTEGFGAKETMLIVVVAFTPVPLRPTVCGLPGALSVTATTAVSFPSIEGVKVTVIAQLAPGRRDVPQVLVSVKSVLFAPVMLRALILKLALPVLVSVTPCGVLVLPTA